MQSFNIMPKIREVDEAIDPVRQSGVREVHPELVFAVLANASSGLTEGKRTPEGRHARMSLLLDHLPGFSPESARDSLGRGAVALDDVIDAAACLVAARRIASGEEMTLPAGGIARDARGLKMEIVA